MMRCIALAVVCVLLITSCNTMQTKQAQGTAIGAATGAAVGGVVKGKKGAVIGGLLGALVGNLIGRHLDQQEAALRNGLQHEIAQGDMVLVRTKDQDAMILSMKGTVLFGTGSATIKLGAYRELDRLIHSWQDNPNINVVITGHTDNLGPLAMNRDLSARRGEAVAVYLVQRGVPSRQLYTRGAGELAPIANNNTPQGRTANRRVDLVFFPAGQNPPEVVLSRTRDTEPVGRSHQYKPDQSTLLASSEAEQRIVESYAFSESDRMKAIKKQSRVNGTNNTRPISPIRPASELI